MFQLLGIYEVSWDGSSFCVLEENSYAICSVRKGKLVSVTCKELSQCKHLTLLHKSIAGGHTTEAPASLFSIMDKLNSYNARAESPAVRVVSTQPIPYEFGSAMQQSLSLSTFDRLNSSGQYDEDYPILAPLASGLCSLCGKPWSHDGSRQYEQPTPVIDKKNTYFVKGMWIK